MDARPVIQSEGLSKSYGDIQAVCDVSLAVRPGEVYGFVGLNGAGKTTVMRMLLGLIRPTSGTARVLGRPLGDPGALARVGSLIEGPAFYPYLPGRANLRLLARYAGAPDDAVGKALDQVGLGARADSRYKTYSLGMKQRLGVAGALLGDPELLILDEPTNGLDPAGITEMRELVRSLRDAGRTVLLSSHLLGEVTEVCDRVGILHQGRLISEGTMAEIHESKGGGDRLLIRAQPLADAAACLRDLSGVRAVSQVAGALELSAGGIAEAEITRALVTAGVEVSEVRVVQQSLEDVFLALTRDDAPASAHNLMQEQR
jgi:ABC-2 type transport system ATP-binding protein